VAISSPYFRSRGLQSSAFTSGPLRLRTCAEITAEPLPCGACLNPQRLLQFYYPGQHECCCPTRKVAPPPMQRHSVRDALLSTVMGARWPDIIDHILIAEPIRKEKWRCHLRDGPAMKLETEYFRFDFQNVYVVRNVRHIDFDISESLCAPRLSILPAIDGLTMFTSLHTRSDSVRRAYPLLTSSI
jgi:hypothetical protein